MRSDMGEQLYRELLEEFFNFVKDRREDGAEEYGQYGFLANDTFRMMYEELADLVNYAFFTYVKLRLIERNANDVFRTAREGHLGQSEGVHEGVETTSEGEGTTTQTN